MEEEQNVLCATVNMGQGALSRNIHPLSLPIEAEKKCGFYRKLKAPGFEWQIGYHIEKYSLV